LVAPTIGADPTGIDSSQAKAIGDVDRHGIRRRRQPAAVAHGCRSVRSQPEVMVGLVPTDLVGEAPAIGACVDDQQLGAHHLGEVDQLLGAHPDRGRVRDDSSPCA
jgi:hypothetical protein